MWIIVAGLEIRPHSLIASDAGAVITALTANSTVIGLAMLAENVGKCMQLLPTETEALRLPVLQDQESVDTSRF